MEYHQERFVDASQLIYKGEKLFAVLPANLDGDILYSHQGLTYGGLVLSPKAKLSELIPAFRELLISLQAKGIKKLNLKQLPVFYCGLPAEEMDYLAFVSKAELTRVDAASVIDYGNRVAVQSNRKEGVKKGEKNQLKIEENTDFRSFWEEILLPNLAERHQARPTHSLKEIELLRERFPKNIRQFNVYKEGVIKGGATIFETKTTAHVQYISAGEGKQELGTLDFLFEHLIEQVFDKKWFFDFGISNEDGGRKLNAGLSYWKECFGARSFVHRFYTFETANHTLLDTVLL